MRAVAAAASWAFAAVAILARPAGAVEPHRSFFDLPSSNGWGAVVVDFEQGKAHHWRDHLYATEEPRVDDTGAEVWTDGSPAFPEVVSSRDLLFDAYFGVAVDGVARWLPSVPVDLDTSGWEDGTSIVRMVQIVDDVRVTTYAWAPWGIERAAAALVVEAENLGASTREVEILGLQNLHLGEGRPGPTEEIGTENETIVLHDEAVEERGFAGVVVTRPLGGVKSRAVHWAAAGSPTPHETVAGGSVGIPPNEPGVYGPHDDNVAYYLWGTATLALGESTFAGVVFAHDGDPFAFDAVDGDLTDWMQGGGADEVLAREREEWAAFQAGLTVPAGLSGDEARLWRRSAVVLRMAQVRETTTFVREWLTRDGEPRFSSLGRPPARMEHAGAGAVLASLPPGRWGYAWPRDSAYAVVGMVHAGMYEEARAALEFQLRAETDRYREYAELSDLPIVPYAVSLCRHHGFGIEESDTLGDGDFNFEFDGAGLYLWALGEYVRASEDEGFLEDHRDALLDRVVAFLPPLVEPRAEGGGLIAADSSIWETHWFGKERHWTYTSITAARGLCDAAEIADQLGETAAATELRDVAETLRLGLSTAATDASGALASNVEERVEAGVRGTDRGYADAAVTEAVAMGLFDPQGSLATSTLALLEAQLTTVDGPGLIRNDDETDELGLSPWGSGYDSSEWVVIDLRTAIAAREAGDPERADALLAWVRDQSLANYGAVGETYDPSTGDYTNNAPMVGFGAGAWIAALAHREGAPVGPACGVYGPEPPESGDDYDSAPDDDDDDSAPDGDGGDDLGCACRSSFGAEPGAPLVALLLIGIAALRANRRPGADSSIDKPRRRL